MHINYRVMNFQHGCSLVSHDLIDSCKVFAAGPMGKADDGLVLGGAGPGGSVRGVKAALSASCSQAVWRTFSEAERLKPPVNVSTRKSPDVSIELQ